MKKPSIKPGPRCSGRDRKTRNKYPDAVTSKSKQRRLVASRRDRNTQSLLKAAEIIIAVVVGLLAFCLYVSTLAPTIVAGDAGELVTAAFEPGIAHPPGYPLWCLLGHVFIKIFSSINDVAYRVNLLSAVCGALTCVLTYILTRRLGVGRMASVTAALLLAASRELWAQSVIAEVYTLNSAIFTACMLCLVQWDLNRKNGCLLLFSFLLGLGLTNHHTVGILGPVGVGFVLCRNWRMILDWRLVAGAIVLFIVPLTLYLYIPLRSASFPYMDWGHPETLEKLWEHVTRAQYGVNYTPLPRTAGSMFFHIVTLGRYFLDQFSPEVGLSITAFIPLVLWRKKKAGWWLVGIIFITVLVAYGWVLNTKFERQEIEANKVFFIPVYCCATILMAGVFEVVGDKLVGALKKRVPLVPSYIICMACLLIPVFWALKYNFKANNFSQYWYAEDYGLNIFATLEENAVIFPSGDHNTFPLIYLHKVKGIRPDITIADKYGYIESRSFPEIETVLEDKTRIPRDQVIDYLLSKTNRALYFTVKWNVPNGLKVHQTQTGLLYRVSPSAGSGDPEKIWSSYRFRNAQKGFDSPPDYGAINVVSDYFFFRALSSLQRQETDEALHFCSRSAEAAKGIKEVYNNIGSALAEHGLLEVAQHYYQEALRLDDSYVSALWNVARTSSAVGDAEGAISYFRRLYEVTPDDFRVPGELGFLYLRHLNSTKQAEDYFHASLGLNPNQSQIQEVLKELEASRSKESDLPAVWSERLSHDFGKVPINSIQSTLFELVNISEEPLDITDIRADCSCTVPKVSTKHLEPGESATVEVSYQESKNFGQQEKHIRVKTSGGETVVLTIHAEVVPLYAAEPQQLNMVDLVPNSSRDFEVEVRGYKDQPFSIKSVVSNLDEVRPIMTDELSVTGSKHTIGVKVDTDSDIGKKKGSMKVYINNPEETSVEIPLNLHVRNPVILTPRSVFLNSLERKGVKNIPVKIDIPAGWSAVITDITVSDSWLSVAESLEKLQGGDTITIQIDTKQLPRSFSGTVSITTENSSIPTIVIPVYGFTK